MKKMLLGAVASALFSAAAIAGPTESDPNAVAYFVNLNDGDAVSGPVHVVFGLVGMGVGPAGFTKENIGHHHLFINRAPFGEGDFGADEADFPIPADDNHKHYGKGQTETMLDLEPGTYTMQMVMGDGDHIPHNNPIFSDVITITVE